MTDYSTKSDAEINELVAIKRNSEFKEWPHHTVKVNDEKQVIVGREGSYTRRVVDYCNNPSDAWPIILEIKKELCEQKIHWLMRRNPLRAAMIVYLMMEGE